MPGCQSCQGDELPLEPPLAAHVRPSSRRGQASSAICTGRSTAPRRDPLPGERGRASFKWHRLDLTERSSSLGGCVLASWQPPPISRESRGRGRIYWHLGCTQPSSPPVRPARITLLRPAPSGHGRTDRSCQTAQRLPAQRRTPPLPSTSSLELLCSENPSDDRSCPQARSLADLMPTPGRPPVAPPGQAHRSPPPSSPLLHPWLPQAGPAGWGSPALLCAPRCRAMAQERGMRRAPASDVLSLAKQQPLRVAPTPRCSREPATPSDPAGRRTLTPARQHQNRSPRGTLQQVLGRAKCFEARGPGAHGTLCLTPPKSSGELSCSRTWLPFLPDDGVYCLCAPKHAPVSDPDPNPSQGVACDLERSLRFRAHIEGLLAGRAHSRHRAAAGVQGLRRERPWRRKQRCWDHAAAFFVSSYS